MTCGRKATGGGQTIPASLLNLRKRIVEDQGIRPCLRFGQLPRHCVQGAAGNRGRDQHGDEASRTFAAKFRLTNFRGIELRDFPAEIARLALVIAEYQGDVLYRGQKLALAEFLPLRAENWITCGNALRLDWLSHLQAPRTATERQNSKSDDLFSTPLDQAQIDFENEGGETYICGNPPVQRKQLAEQKSRRRMIWRLLLSGSKHPKLGRTTRLTSPDGSSKRHFLITVDSVPLTLFQRICGHKQQYVKASRFQRFLWPIAISSDLDAKASRFAHTSFKWANLASHNAGVSVVVVGIASEKSQVRQKKLFETESDGTTNVQLSARTLCTNSVAYLLNANEPYLLRAQRLTIAFDARIT